MNRHTIGSRKFPSARNPMNTEKQLCSTGQIHDRTNQNVYFSYCREHSTCFLDLINIFILSVLHVGAVSRLVSDPPPNFLHWICMIHKNDLTSIEKHGNPRFRGKITSMDEKGKYVCSR